MGDFSDEDVERGAKALWDRVKIDSAIGIERKNLTENTRWRYRELARAVLSAVPCVPAEEHEAQRQRLFGEMLRQAQEIADNRKELSALRAECEAVAKELRRELEPGVRCPDCQVDERKEAR